jgi:hypothetical protein
MDDRAREVERGADTSGTFEFEENSTPASGPSSRRRRQGILVVMTLILAVTLLLLLATQDTGDQQHAMTVLTPGSRATQSLLVRMSTPPPSALAPAPMRCPESTTSHPQLGHIIYYATVAYGVPPVWMLGLQSQPQGRVVHFEAFPPLTYTVHGWRWRILVVSTPGFRGQITLSGEQIAGGLSTALLLDAGAGLMSLVRLDPHNPTTTGQGWAQWPIYVYLPGSGCYFLAARWPGGNWQISFAAGS